MFCPACADARETLRNVPGKKNVYRCSICGHVFYIEIRPRIEKTMGDGTHDYTFAWAKPENKIKGGNK
jgi:rubredoxin